MTDGVTQGPLINEKAVNKVASLVKNAVEKGAKIVMGGEVIPESNIYKPTILTGVTSEMEIANVEIFGPVIAIQKFENEDEVLKKANDSRVGLAGESQIDRFYYYLGYIFSTDMSQIHRVSRLIQVGMLGVNEGRRHLLLISLSLLFLGAISCAEAAFGGVKESGLGREGGRQGIDEFTNWKYISIAY
jgi:succinate-semialdehyde dehydrogenase